MLKSKKVRVALAGVAAIAIVALVVFAAMQSVSPLRALTRYPLPTLMVEATTMDDCSECHDTSQFHTCQTCHDDHGALELARVPFNSLILLTGDVPKPGYIAVNEILPYVDGPATHVALADFLASRGVADFQAVALATGDGGLVTVERANLTSQALLMPYLDGLRFAAEDLHVSTWMKGITRIVVVGNEKPLRIDGQDTSIGRLLLGPLASVTVEQTDVMLVSPSDSQVRKAKTASREEGAPLRDLVANPDWQTLQVRDAKGQQRTIAAADGAGAVLTVVSGQVTLVLPERGRSQWVAGVVEISSGK